MLSIMIMILAGFIGVNIQEICGYVYSKLAA